jgi:hypothetical protein
MIALTSSGRHKICVRKALLKPSGDVFNILWETQHVCAYTEISDNFSHISGYN